MPPRPRRADRTHARDSSPDAPAPLRADLIGSADRLLLSPEEYLQVPGTRPLLLLLLLLVIRGGGRAPRLVAEGDADCSSLQVPLHMEICASVTAQRILDTGTGALLLIFPALLSTSISFIRENAEEEVEEEERGVLAGATNCVFEPLCGSVWNSPRYQEGITATEEENQGVGGGGATSCASRSSPWATGSPPAERRLLFLLGTACLHEQIIQEIQAVRNHRGAPDRVTNMNCQAGKHDFNAQDTTRGDVVSRGFGFVTSPLTLVCHHDRDTEAQETGQCEPVGLLGCEPVQRMPGWRDLVFTVAAEVMPLCARERIIQRSPLGVIHESAFLHQQTSTWGRMQRLAACSSDQPSTPLRASERERGRSGCGCRVSASSATGHIRHTPSTDSSAPSTRVQLSNILPSTLLCVIRVMVELLGCEAQLSTAHCS
ncbi:unnamed protein product [Pleuronectes platessa]|uniref:Uncharacterized protein n=1 Tax=Pleuronectes platessa TaxID=8262 RepID=A0A9N7Z470_PLEPL|nr:unnamed protein product [Pleuronectes platessa]